MTERRRSVASNSPQFWESGPLPERNRLYFTAESGGRVIAGASGLGATLTREQAVSLAAWLLRVADAESCLDERAEAAYIRDAGDSSTPFAELAEWKREAWRCEVDPDRDPRGITRAKEAESCRQNEDSR